MKRILKAIFRAAALKTEENASQAWTAAAHAEANAAQAYADAAHAVELE